MYKLILVFVIVGLYVFTTSFFTHEVTSDMVNSSTKQIEDSGTELHRQIHLANIGNSVYILGWIMIGFVALLIFNVNIQQWLKRAGVLLLLILASGCYRPFEPIKLETISNTEEAFLIPLAGDVKQQKSTNKEQFLKENMVLVKQIKIPQQWVQIGYETFGANGNWQDAATLIKVDTSPVTREWTADPNSGTSSKNEAIWVMTADQVEFSTGWQCTARIANRDDAVKFLFNYPNGSLKSVLDSEVRGKLQTTFGLEVTDLPMEELRKSATPHIQKTVKAVSEFFRERGITITNLGISGGFIYKDQSIIQTMVKVFNAEQEHSIAAAVYTAQQERNKTVISEADGKAEALLRVKKAEAEGIKSIADAKRYEIEKAADKLPTYLSLKQLELQRNLLDKWDGKYPYYFMGNAANPNMLLQLPQVEK